MLNNYDNRKGKKDIWTISHDNSTFDFSIVKKGQVVKTSRSIINNYTPSRNDYDLRLGNLQLIIQVALKVRIDKRAIDTLIKTYIDNIAVYISDANTQFARDIQNHREEWLDTSYDDTTLRLYFIDVIEGLSDDSFNI